MEDDRSELQKRFEEETPTIMNVGVSGLEYLQTFCSWLEFQVEKLTNKKNKSDGKETH